SGGRDLPRPSGSAQNPHVSGVRRPPAPQGLPRGEGPAARPLPHRGRGRRAPRRDRPLPRGRGDEPAAQRARQGPGGSAHQARPLLHGGRLMAPLDMELEEGELELPAELMHLNMGPSHPAMHGTVRIVLELSGETIVKADVQIGYLHRGFEKMCERGTWAQVFPYADRLNYVSPMLNNVGYALAVEKLCEIQVPDRCQWYRMMLGELARVSDHLTCTGAMAMELGAFTPFLWFVKAREMVWDILEEETGARLTHSFGRIGGMANPPTPALKEMCRSA